VSADAEHAADHASDDAAATSPAVEVAPAATVVLVRDGRDGIETLLLRRSPQLSFSAGAWVFPGGRVDPEDVAAAGGGDPFGPDAARHAAARELTEEAGLVVPAADLVSWSHWTTPPGPPRRFATWFFVAPEGEVEDVVVDGGEIHAADWLTPAAAHARARTREMDLAPPTWLTLRQVAEHRTVADLLAHAATATDQVYEPRIARDADGAIVSLYAGDAGWPSADPSVAGTRHRIVWLVDDYRFERSS
jgi:8-oxo-dGTP pyrophosphatase MutT (NUDIX family)